MKGASHNKGHRLKVSLSPLLDKSGGQQDEEHGIVHHVLGEQHQSYLFTIYQEDLIHALGLTLSTPSLVLKC